MYTRGLNPMIRSAVRAALRLRGVAACLLGASIAAPAMAQQAAADDMEEVTVTGHTEFFRPVDASSATKFDLAVQDTPQAIAVLTDDILQTFGASELYDISKFVAGVQSSPSSQNSNFFIGGMQARGFRLDGQSGFKINGFSTLREFQPDLVAVERVEFLKGPSSVLYGVNNYGGTLNTVLKKPEAEAAYTVKFTGGNYDYYRLEGDATGPINSSGSARYRVATAYQDNSSIRDGSEFQRIPLFAQLEFDLSEKTTMDLYGLFQRERVVDDFGLTATRDADGNYAEPFDVPRDVFAGDPSVNDLERDSYQVFAGIKHRYDSGYHLEFKAGQTKNTLKYKAQYMYNYGYAATPFAGVYYSTNDRTTKSSDAELTFGGDFEAMGGKNTFIVAAEYRKIEQDAIDYAFDNLGLVDQTDPDLSTLNPPRPIVDETLGGTFQQENRKAIAAQLLLRPTEKFSVLLGGRYDEVDKDYNQQRHDPDPDDDVVVAEIDIQSTQTIDEFTPRLGLVYEVTPQINVYYSYTQGFIPQDGVTRSGRDIKPETGTQNELGIKGEFRDGRLGATLAVFSIEREDVAISDPTNGPEDSFRIDGRAQEHKGIELEVLGQPFDNFNVVATFAYLDAEVTQADDFPDDVGNSILGAPKNSGSLFLQYEIPEGALKGLAFGAGATYVGERVSQETDLIAPWGLEGGFTPFNFDAYTTIDLSLRYYGLEHMVFGVDVNNISDEDYFEYGADCCGGNYLQRGTPREIRGFFSYSF